MTLLSLLTPIANLFCPVTEAGQTGVREW